jgi:hypothetical protein
VRACGENDQPAAIAAMLKRIRPSLLSTEAEIVQALDPENFIRVRTTTGGPAPEQTRDALRRANGQQVRMETWAGKKRALLDSARAALRGRSASTPA